MHNIMRRPKWMQNITLGSCNQCLLMTANSYCRLVSYSSKTALQHAPPVWHSNTGLVEIQLHWRHCKGWMATEFPRSQPVGLSHLGCNAWSIPQASPEAQDDYGDEKCTAADMGWFIASTNQQSVSCRVYGRSCTQPMIMISRKGHLWPILVTDWRWWWWWWKQWWTSANVWKHAYQPVVDISNMQCKLDLSWLNSVSTSAKIN